ncbi:pickpocket protein 19-like [Calliphora vicina]|uniref:pickpocket protein 19-like n=1 Tax=Calliphora vicina TaxID=7373 RepID=UPI00325BF333
MLVHEDYKHFRVTPNNKLQHFPGNTLKLHTTPKTVNKFEQDYWQYFRCIVDEFVGNFTMHGVDRIFKRKLNKYKRITWIFGFSVCLMVCIYVSCQVAFKYHTKPLVTVVSKTHLPVFQIPFPEVTICNKNRFNWQRFERAKEMFLKPEHQTNPEYQEIFMEVVNAYDTLIFGKFYKFENLTKVPPSMLKELNYVNFSLVSEFMAWKCHEIFTDCLWIDDDYDCCEIFFMRNSQMGTCLAFNTIESPEGVEKQKLDSFWPWRSKGQGDENGLMLKVHLREYEHSPMRRNKKGILVMLAEPYVWFNYPIEVNTHTRTSVSITAILHNFDNYTRIFSPRDELNSKYYKSLAGHRYMFENCQAECQQEYLIRFCNCTLSLFYPAGQHRPCKLVDYPCLFYHNDKLQYFEQIGESKYVSEYFPDVMKCTCYYNCKSLTYITKVTTAYMNNMEAEFNNSYIDLSLFYQQEFIVAFLTTVLYTWTDLMASFGGLAGLCIGCSLISLVEFAYFFLVDIPRKTMLYYKMKKRLRLHRKSCNIRADIVENILRS